MIVAPWRQNHRSLTSKLDELERRFQSCGPSADLEYLNGLLRELEGVVKCDRCHLAYRALRGSVHLENRIARIQERACPIFGILEKQTGRSLTDQDSIARYLREVSLSALGEAAGMHLTHRSRILFVGCGSVPISCHVLASHFGCQVVGLDTDPECVEAARSYSLRTVQSSRLSFHLADGKEFELDGFTHVLVASLVANKEDVVRHVTRSAKGELQLALRHGDGLGCLINYPLPALNIAPWLRVNLFLNPGGLYQTLYLTRGPRCT